MLLQTCFREINLQNFLDSDTSNASSTVLPKLVSPQNAGLDFIVLGTLLPNCCYGILYLVVMFFFEFTGNFLKTADLQTAVKECYWLFILD